MTDEQAEALADVEGTFAGYEVDHEQAADGGLWVVLRHVSIGAGWNRDVIDLSVKLQVTFPSTRPYPFYCESGLARTDGQSFAPIQPCVEIGDGNPRTQISLLTQGQEHFDIANETLSGRLMAVIAWLRNPR